MNDSDRWTHRDNLPGTFCDEAGYYGTDGEYRMFVQGDVRYDGHDQHILILRYMRKTIPHACTREGSKSTYKSGWKQGDVRHLVRSIQRKKRRTAEINATYSKSISPSLATLDSIEAESSRE